MCNKIIFFSERDLVINKNKDEDESKKVQIGRVKRLKKSIFYLYKPDNLLITCLIYFFHQSMSENSTLKRVAEIGVGCHRGK